VEPLAADGVLRRGAKSAIAKLSGYEPLPVAALAGWFEEEALIDALELSLPWYARHTGESARQTMAYPLRVVERRGGGALLETPRICVGTIHSVKGGEADVVVLFPDLSRSGYEEWSRPGAGRDALRRLFYVGMTRTRDSLVLGSPSGPMAVDL
jgi:superfamily I DNA/RNA helicase